MDCRTRTRRLAARALLALALLVPLHTAHQGGAPLAHAQVAADRVLETSTTTGTGTVDLDGATTGYRTFKSALGFTAGGAGVLCYYLLTDGTDWEVGEGTASETVGGQEQLARDEVLASTTGSKINWGPGTRDVALIFPAAKVVQRDVNDYIGALTAALRFACSAGNCTISESGFTADSQLWHFARFAYAGNTTKGSLTLGPILINWITVNVDANTTTGAQSFQTAFSAIPVTAILGHEHADTGTVENPGYSELGTTSVKLTNADGSAADITIVVLGLP